MSKSGPYAPLASQKEANHAPRTASDRNSAILKGS
jgi:hypothetical protein